MKMSTGFGSSKASLLGLQMATLSLCHHVVLPLGTLVCVLFSSSYEDISCIGLGPST